MPPHHCKTCRSPLHADDTHAECVSWLGKSHADNALNGTDCSHCESFSLASLRLQIAFFLEAHCALPFSSSQGPVRKKQRGRGFERPVTSMLTPAQCPRASPSPQREHSPVLFTQHDQRPSAAASDISFGVSDNELDDILSLAASDAEELLGSVTDPALLPSSASRNQTQSGWRAHPHYDKDKGNDYGKTRFLSNLLKDHALPQCARHNSAQWKHSSSPGSPHFYTMHGCSLPSATDGNLHTQIPWQLAHSGPVAGGFNIA